MVVGLIGGSGLERLIEGDEVSKVKTPYGDITVVSGFINGVKVLFVSRHGPRHEYPPHKVSYRGNLYALRSLGVDKVVATSAVGSLLEELPPGSLIIVDQFIDFTKRHITFYDDVVVHVDVTRPYCPSMNRILFEAGKNVKAPIRLGGIYVCTEGPRFETPAEIGMFRVLGASVVGMTNVPEVVLAREIGLHYSLLAIATNYAAGMQSRVSQEEVVEIMKRAENNVRKLLSEALPKVDEFDVDDDCILYREYAEKYILGRDGY